ncbi:flagellar hook-associated protein FlgL [bacterium]|nr:flagellar hook-associated protein FlgL [bacterium]
MRVTENSMFNQLRRQVFRNSDSLINAQERMATQKRINRISDNPVSAARVLDLKSSISRSKQTINNIEHATSVADTYDTVTGQLSDLLGRAKELVVKESNEATSTAATREAARIELSNLTSEMVQIANTQFEGKYIFSGYQTDKPAFNDATVAAGGAPVTAGTLTAASKVLDATAMNDHDYEIRFTAANAFDVVDVQTGLAVASNQSYTSGQAIRFGGVEVTVANGTGSPSAGMVVSVTTTPPGAYNGDGQTQEIEIGQGNRIATNLTGDRVFQGVGISGGIDLFALMNSINTALSEGDYDTIQAKLDELDTASEQVSNERARNGTRVNLLEQLKDRQSSIQDSLEILRSDLEDIDVAEAMTDLTKAQNVYEATLTAASQIIQPSLLDFLQ